MSKVVLVTGGSRGIGAAIVSSLKSCGMTVYAASRSGKVDTEGAFGVVMDVNSAESIASAVDRILKEQGRLDAVVVNAGNGVAGAMEETSEVEMRYQFETNFFGAIKTINGCIPALRASRGRIVAVTSVAALLPLPYQGLYSSVKAALQMAVKAYSVELKPFGIQCCAVLPGDTSTGFTAARKFAAASSSPDSLYKERFDRCIAKIEKDETGGMPPSRIASAVKRQICRRRMKTTVIPRLDYWAIGLLVRLLPERLVLWIVGLLYNS